MVASGILRARYGLGQGFDVYRDDLFATAPGVTSGRGIAEARADVATDAALAWLSERSDAGRVFPVYAATEGLGQKQIRTIVRANMEELDR